MAFEQLREPIRGQGSSKQLLYRAGLVVSGFVLVNFATCKNYKFKDKYQTLAKKWSRMKFSPKNGAYLEILKMGCFDACNTKSAISIAFWAFAGQCQPQSSRKMWAKP